ncbi:MAG: hypothetical protein IT243_00545 [Bacteroidia bacterium]|nr:hypothetical protein [Bacteroidia bacterium]
MNYSKINKYSALSVIFTSRIALLYFFLIINFSLFSQSNFKFYTADSLPDFISLPTTVNNIKNGEIQCSKIIARLLSKGYVSSGVDTIFQRNDTIFFSIYYGKRCTWGNVNLKNLPENLISKFGFHSTVSGVINLSEIQKSMNLTIDYFENKGYPFAYFYWDSLKIENDTIHGNLFFEKNFYITFDTVAIYGDKVLTKNFIYNYTGIKPGEPFSENLFRQINKRFEKLPYATLQKSPQVYFVERKAVILLVLKKKSVNRLDGIAGFAPSTDNGNSNKMLLTGEFHIDLKNIKGSGIAFKSDWQSFKQRSQNFTLGFSLPYILNKPIGSGFNIDLLKYDTLYTEAKFAVNFNYIFSGNDQLSFFYEKQSTNLLNADTSHIRNTGKIGNFTPMRNYSYGVFLSKNTLSSILNPQKGFATLLKISFSKRSIIKDNNINNVKFYNPKTSSFYTIYDSIKLRTFQLKFQYEFIKVFPIIKNTLIYTEIKGSGIVSPDVYYNELYRFGGFSTLKGFNEQSLFASTYSIINLEIRYLLSENSFVRMFGNAAYYQDKSNRQNKIAEDIPIGYGLGINLETGAGIVNLSVAQGKSKYNPAEFRNTKIHIGLINYF